jgi:predicted DNA-binding transcriptional regulator AlpA
MTHHLVGPAEIGEMLGVTRQRVDQLARDDKTFPTPVASLATGRVWESEAVEKWARDTGRIT